MPAKPCVTPLRAVDDEDVTFFGTVSRRRFELLAVTCSMIVEVAVLRRLDDGQQDALVFFRRQFLGVETIHDAGHRQHADQDQHRQGAEVQRRVQAALVAAGAGDRTCASSQARNRRPCQARAACSSFEHIIGDSVSAMTPDTTTEPASVKANSLEQRAGEARDEADRRIDRGQRDRHGDDRQRDFARALSAASSGVMPVLDVAVDVLDHDDRVVDHQPDRQHEGEQRQEIDRIAQRQQEHHHADQRQRDGDDRDQRRAQIAEEQEDDDDDDQRRLDQRLGHLADRGADEFGGVIGDAPNGCRAAIAPGCPETALRTTSMTVSGLAVGVA